MPAERPDLGDNVLTAGVDDGNAPKGLSLRVLGETLFATHPLPASGALLIGRSEEADVRIDHPSVSRKHAVLHLGPPLAIEDLGSANGTRAHDRAIAPGERVTIAPGEGVDLGSVMIVVQSVAAGARARRLSSHGFFERRLVEECARAGAASARFDVVRLHVEGPVAASAVESALVDALGPRDLGAGYGPGEYELMLVDPSASARKSTLDAAIGALGARQAIVRAGVASYGFPAITADELIAAACRALAGGAEDGAPIVDPSGAMQRLMPLVDRIARGDISVLILGETGAGKEVMAETIHARSPRAQKPLLRLHCCTLSEALLESELFGYEKGAFTGAQQTKPGLLETAHGGTVFLDEIGELPPSFQVKLLRVLEDRTVMRVGSIAPRAIDVRFVAATNRDLEKEIARGAFRADLFFRLNGVSITIPPLRERTSEIEGLARGFLERAARRASLPVPTLSIESLALLRRYAWPGNVRELRNMMERALLLADGNVITPDVLPVEKMGAALSGAALSAPSVVESEPASAPSERGSLERARVMEALARCAGNQTQAAKLLGISRGTLVARLAEFNLPRPRKRG